MNRLYRSIAPAIALAGLAAAQVLCADPGPCLAQALSAPPPDSAPQGYEVTGTAPAGSDAVRARERALQGAMQRALEQAVLQAAPEVRGRLYLVTARARDYVPTYRVLSEGEADGQFQVRIAAQVDLPRLLHNLQAGGLATPRRQVRAVVLVCPGAADREARGVAANDRPDEAAALNAVREALLARAEVPPASACGPQLGAAMAAAGAQAAVQVSAEPAPADEIRGTSPLLYGAHAQVRLGLYGAGGKSLEEQAQEADASAAAPGTAAEKAQSTAALLGLGWLQGALGAVLPGAADEGVTVALEGLGLGPGSGSEGIEGYRDYRRLLKTLAALPGVRAAEPRRFTAGKVELLLRTAGAAEPLGAALGRTPISGLRLQVMPQGPSRLRVLVAAESALPATPVPAGAEPAGAAPPLPASPAAGPPPTQQLPPPPPLPRQESAQ